MTIAARARYTRYRFPAVIISCGVAVFPLPARASHVEELLAARGIIVCHETVRQ